MARNIYVIDTCVLLADPTALTQFADHDIYLPLPVIDDLDDIKTRREPSGWAAREVFRVLSSFCVQDMTTKGASIPNRAGKLFIYNPDAAPDPASAPNFARVHSDNAIISAARDLKAANPRRKVVVVTQDTALRVRAIAWGCEAADYQSATNSDDVYTGIRRVQVSDLKTWETLWAADKLVPGPEVKEIVGEMNPNEFLIFQYGESLCPAMVKNGAVTALKTKTSSGEKVSYLGISPKNLEQKFAMTALADETIPLVTLCGKAGTGKTILALSVALDKINSGIYDKLIIIKPLIAVGGKDIGFLPGSKIEKISAWLGPARDNIEQLIAPSESGEKKEKNHWEKQEQGAKMMVCGIIELPI